MPTCSHATIKLMRAVRCSLNLLSICRRPGDAGVQLKPVAHRTRGWRSGALAALAALAATIAINLFGLNIYSHIAAAPSLMTDRVGGAWLCPPT